MNKKIICSFISVVIILCAALVYLIKKIPEKNFQIINSQKMISFNLQYNIKVWDSNLVPAPIVANEKLTSEERCIAAYQLYYLYDYFEINLNKNFVKSKTISLYPREFVQVRRTSRYQITEEFLTSRGVSANNAKKTLTILKQEKFTQQLCLKKLQRIYVGSDFNKEFFKRAIPKLIDF